MAVGGENAKRYPPTVTPFIAVPEATPASKAALDKLVSEGETVGILSVIPDLGEHWATQKEFEIHQYIWDEDTVPPADAETVPLDESHIPAMLELTSLVYPAYFRAETARLGNYFGIIRGAQLVAMAGIRMAFDGHQELSAICTHPDFRGQGLAARLTNHLIAHVHAQGDVPFLHTEWNNDPAKALYEKLGFRISNKPQFRVVQKVS